MITIIGGNPFWLRIGLKTCCCYFTLKIGTIIIGSLYIPLNLTLAACSLILFGSNGTQHNDFDDHSFPGLFPNFPDIYPTPFRQEFQKRIQPDDLGQINLGASELSHDHPQPPDDFYSVDTDSTIVAVGASIQVFLSILLIFGAVKEKRLLLFPWIFFSLFAAHASIAICVFEIITPLGDTMGKEGLFLGALLTIAIYGCQLYLWFVVFSFYIKLTKKLYEDTRILITIITMITFTSVYHFFWDRIALKSWCCYSLKTATIIIGSISINFYMISAICSIILLRSVGQACPAVEPDNPDSPSIPNLPDTHSAPFSLQLHKQGDNGIRPNNSNWIDFGFPDLLHCLPHPFTINSDFVSTVLTIISVAAWIQVIFSILLIFGAAKENRFFLFPWIGASFLAAHASIAGCAFGVVIPLKESLGQGGTFLGVFLTVAIYGCHMYLWFVVFSNFIQLTMKTIEDMRILVTVTEQQN